jgi:putative ABC transport system substrate-binding protein
VNNRRKLVIALGAGMLTAPFGSFAQPQGKLWRIGILHNGSSVSGRGQIDAFTRGLEKLGYTEGGNFFFMVRFADGQIERLPALALDLVARNPDIIIATNTPAVRAAKQATTRVPIVFTTVGDPVGNDFVVSLAKPGRNITGLSIVAVDLAAKRLQLLLEVVPKAARIALITGGSTAAQAVEAERAAKALGIQTLTIDLDRRDDLANARGHLKEWRADALDILQGNTSVVNSELLAELAATMRLPAIAGARANAEDGTLISYGPHYEESSFRAATYVDKILKGTKPADLPVEQPTKFELVLNMRTAKALGIRIPNSVLVQATKVIE